MNPFDIKILANDFAYSTRVISVINQLKLDSIINKDVYIRNISFNVELESGKIIMGQTELKSNIGIKSIKLNYELSNKWIIIYNDNCSLNGMAWSSNDIDVYVIKNGLIVEKKTM